MTAAPARWLPFDPDEYMARFSAAFAYAYPETEAYRLGQLSFSTYLAPANGWPVVSDDLDGPLRDPQGQLLGIPQVMVIAPSLGIDLNRSMAEALLEPDAFSRMPEFNRRPEHLPMRLDDLAAEILGRSCAGCFRIDLPVAAVDEIKASRSKPQSFSLSYFRIMPDEPSAQQ